MDPARTLDRLPEPADRRLAVRVTPDAMRQLRGGSPWLYDGSISSVNHDGAPGDLAVVFDEHRKFVAIGLWDPGSPIRVKILHHGAPQQIDRDWWRYRLADSFERRSTLAADPDTTAYRCVHGENDGLPGLVVDRYAETLVVKLYSPIWFAHLRTIVDLLVESQHPERIVLRLARSLGRGETYGLRDGDTIHGTAPTGPLTFSERGLTFEADVVHGNKTGHFLDQRDNRALVRAMAEGASVLDVFSSTGGFSVSAAAGGATSVHMVDISEPAVRAAERNLVHNRHIRAVRECQVRTTVGDAFEVLAALKARPERYDLVVVDPPSFAQNRASVPAALRAYARLTYLALPLVAPDGVLVQCSCSSRVPADEFANTVYDTALRSGYELRELRRTGHPLDHPIGFEHGAYLKAVYARVNRS